MSYPIKSRQKYHWRSYLKLPDMSYGLSFLIHKNLLLLKTLFTLSLLSFVSCQRNAPEKFHIDGFVEGAANQLLLVKKFDGEGFQLIDSVWVRNGEFKYSGKLNHPELFRFYLANSDNYFPVFLENKRIVINTSLRNFHAAKVSGSTSHQLYQTFVNHIDSINQVADPLLKTLKSNTKLSKGDKIALKNRLDSLGQQQVEYIKKFVLDHRQSVVSLYILYKYLSNELSVEEFEQIYKQMDTTLYDCRYMDYIEHQIDIMKHSRVGQKAYNLVLPDTTGTSIALETIHNRYILLHFWASWCDACRAEIPEVVNLYRQHQKYLTIVGISLDNNYRRWTEAIVRFQLNWQHISDLRGWKNKAASIFGVRAIPYYILLDENKTILYKGNSLDEVKKIIENGR